MNHRRLSLRESDYLCNAANSLMPNRYPNARTVRGTDDNVIHPSKYTELILFIDVQYSCRGFNLR